ncbi:gamma-glutamyl-gamma-aminobutyrate hydrolase family protein [Erysipelatoclostridium sp. AM42-17]|nr:gamma-glutamyl-gamma-aminobutyrate hydrolase family protein [Coprobacillus sp. AF33-1AC]RHS93397.1 gamma-glutamyl-gamma-aminobutyrate hydrolase family protein [Erysipelatoclostridium sp. AM42-17]
MSSYCPNLKATNSQGENMSKLLLTLLRTKNKDTFYLYKNYFDYLKQKGIDLISIYDLSKTNLDLLIQLSDGLLLTGGKDIHPHFYHQNCHHLEAYETLSIDEIELHLIDYFIQNQKPIIGICRGIQTINVYFGGTLKQHIVHHQGTQHLIYPVKNSLLSQYIPHPIQVNSYHHQAIDQLGKHLKITAYSSDSIIEAIEGKNILAFQWHPEKMNQEPLLNMIDDYLEEK